jgi:iron complex transport system ATP-binding protein
MTIFRLEKINAAPWGEPLLRDINLELASGEVLGIIGPNGAGKTSLLNILSGDISPSSGRYELLGTAIAEWELLPRARIMAVLPQLSLLNFPYTVEEVIMLGRTPHSSGLHRDRIILQEVMGATDTTALQHRIYTQLSGGEKQRVQLARVFAQLWVEDDSPRLLLLDEPTTALDLAHQQLIMATIRQLADSGCAVVMVAHDFNLVTSVADRLAAICAGRLVSQGNPEAVLSRGLFEDIFGVSVTVSTHPGTGRPLVIHL